MYRFFVEPIQVSEEEVLIVGSDVNHIKNVLRFVEGQEISVCDNSGKIFECEIASLTNEEIRCKIQSVEESKSELPIKITLFQGAPKQDKLELIIQKCVELGVYDLVPVSMKRTIVKYDPKKLHKKLSRWQQISESAAKQSKRAIIPELRPMVTFKEMISKLGSYDRIIVPYENADGMEGTRDIFKTIEPGMKVAVIIGPEGGIDDQELVSIEQAGGRAVTLGNRILRTETAGIACLAMISYQIEEA